MRLRESRRPNEVLGGLLEPAPKTKGLGALSVRTRDQGFDRVGSDDATGSINHYNDANLGLEAPKEAARPMNGAGGMRPQPLKFAIEAIPGIERCRERLRVPYQPGTDVAHIWRVSTRGRPLSRASRDGKK